MELISVNGTRIESVAAAIGTVAVQNGNGMALHFRSAGLSSTQEEHLDIVIALDCSKDDGQPNIHGDDLPWGLEFGDGTMVLTGCTPGSAASRNIEQQCDDGPSAKSCVGKRLAGVECGGEWTMVRTPEHFASVASWCKCIRLHFVPADAAVLTPTQAGKSAGVKSAGGAPEKHKSMAAPSDSQDSKQQSSGLPMHDDLQTALQSLDLTEYTEVLRREGIVTHQDLVFVTTPGDIPHVIPIDLRRKLVDYAAERRCAGRTL